MKDPLARKKTLKSLLSEKLTQKRMSKKDLVLKIGYKNINKGLRKIDELDSSYTFKNKSLLLRLGDALDIGNEQIQQAMSVTIATWKDRKVIIIDSEKDH